MRLAALPVWETTRPAPRTIGGHEGVFMELNVPADLPATCRRRTLQLARPPRRHPRNRPRARPSCLWIVDVDGQRVMLLAGYFPGPAGPTPKQVDEMTLMAEGATFVDADQIVP